MRTFARSLTAALLLAATVPLSSPAQTLPVTSGLLLWLKADAGVTTNGSALVASWADQSGMGNDATQTNPAVAPSVVLNSLNGKPTLRFPGDVTRYLDVADSPSISGLTDDVTILALVLYDDLTGGYRCCVTKTVGNGPAPFDCWNNAGANGGAANFWLGAAPATTTYQDNIGINPPRVGVFNVMIFSWGSGTVNQYLNNRSNGTTTYTTTPADGGNPLRIGSRNDLVTQLKGNVAEILIYQPALSATDLASVVSYLQTKWNLNFILPPSVSIQTPASGLTAPAQAAIPVSVEASDSNPNGVLTSVTLLNNGSTVASWTQPPYNVDLLMLDPGSAVLTAIAADNFGAAATSSPVSITVTGAVPVLKPITNGLQVWLRADAGVMTNSSGLVTNWVDQSGNGNDASQTNTTSAPLWMANVINGEPALDFGTNALSANQFLEVSDAGTAFLATSNFTILVEARFADFDTYRALVAKTASGIAAPIDWWFAPSSGIANAFMGDGTTDCPVGATLPAVAGQFGTYGLGADGTNFSLFLNFATDGTAPITATAASTGNPLRIGQRDDGVTQMAGDIAEILMYNYPLAATDQSNAVLYLSGKYGVAQAIISNPPVTLSITSPTNGATFAMSSAVPVTINASNSVGSIVQVLLLANGFQVVVLTNSPYRVPVDLLTPGTVSLTAVLVDNVGLASTSAPVTLTVTGSPATAPSTNDVRFWFSADVGVQTSGGTVSQWNDRSGNGNTALPGTTSPTLVQNAINGQPALHFNAGDYLDVATAPSIEIVGDISSYAVVLFEDFANYRALWAKTKGNLPASIDYYLLPTTGVPQLFRGNGTSYGSLGADHGVPAGAYMVLGYEMGGQTATHYINGASAGSGLITAPLGDAGTDLLIGTRGDLFTQLKGDLAEVITFGHALSSTEHAQVLSYLAGKYNQQLVSVAYLPPTVTILSPTNGATEGASTPFNFEVNVTDTNNPIAQVSFLVNGNVIGSATAPPYSMPLESLTPGTVTLQAQAVDIWGALGTSAPVVLTVTGQGPASPPASGLVLWLKADKGVTTNADGTVAEWADQSGLGNNAVQTNAAASPVLTIDGATGRPALEFNGTNSQYLSVASAPSLVIQGDISTFCAFDIADVAMVHTLWSKTTNGLAFPWLYDVAVGGDLVFTRGNDNGQAPVGGTAPVTPGTPAASGAIVSGSLASLYLDGEPNGSGVMGYGALDVGTPLIIGALDNLTNQYAGKLSEILIYNQALSGDGLLLVNTYLAARSSIPVIQVPPPSLTITRPTASLVQLSWPTTFNGFILESATDLPSGAWTPVATNPPNNTLVVGTTNVARFFRLESQ